MAKMNRISVTYVLWNVIHEGTNAPIGACKCNLPEIMPEHPTYQQTGSQESYTSNKI